MGYFSEIDLHGLTASQARSKLDSTMKALPDDVRELTVIHGYHQGTALLNLVRSYKHPRLERKMLGMNQGSTIFLIRKNRTKT